MNKKIVLPGRKIKSPKSSKKKSPQRSLDKYLNFINEPVPRETKDEKVIKVKRRHSPKSRSKSSVDIKDINDIEQKMLEIKGIQMPTQNNALDPVVQKSSPKSVAPAKTPKTPIAKTPIPKTPIPKTPKTPKTPIPKTPAATEDMTTATEDMTTATEDMTTATDTDTTLSPQKSTVKNKSVPDKMKVHRSKSQSQSQSKSKSKSKSKATPPVTLHGSKKVHKRPQSRSVKRKTRRVNVKSSLLNESDVLAMEARLKDIRSKKTSDIKKELESQGIKVSGKSNRLLKDIYMYSRVCNINIVHEK